MFGRSRYNPFHLANTDYPITQDFCRRFKCGKMILPGVSNFVNNLFFHEDWHKKSMCGKSEVSADMIEPSIEDALRDEQIVMEDEMQADEEEEQKYGNSSNKNKKFKSNDIRKWTKKAVAYQRELYGIKDEIQATGNKVDKDMVDWCNLVRNGHMPEEMLRIIPTMKFHKYSSDIISKISRTTTWTPVSAQVICGDTKGMLATRADLIMQNNMEKGRPLILIEIKCGYEGSFSTDPIAQPYETHPHKYLKEPFSNIVANAYSFSMLQLAATKVLFNCYYQEKISQCYVIHASREGINIIETPKWFKAAEAIVEKVLEKQFKQRMSNKATKKLKEIEKQQKALNKEKAQLELDLAKKEHAKKLKAAVKSAPATSKPIHASSSSSSSSSVPSSSKRKKSSKSSDTNDKIKKKTKQVNEALPDPKDIDQRYSLGDQIVRANLQKVWSTCPIPNTVNFSANGSSYETIVRPSAGVTDDKTKLPKHLQKFAGKLSKNPLPNSGNFLVTVEGDDTYDFDDEQYYVKDEKK